MNGKMSRKSVLISKFPEDEKIKDAFKLFAARIVNDSKLTSIELSEQFDDESDRESGEQSDADDGRRSAAEVDDIDDDDDDNDDNDEEEEVELCTDCQCVKRSTNRNSRLKESSIEKKKRNEIMKRNALEVEIQRAAKDDNNDESCDCEDCRRYVSDQKISDENAVKLIAEEERKKRKSEKKKLQKKKKREKRRAEKVTNNSDNSESNEPNGQQKKDIDNSLNNLKNNNSNNIHKKPENSKQNTNKQKTEIKTNSKPKTNCSDNSQQKEDIKRKAVIESKSNHQLSSLVNTQDSDRIVSNKSSPKSERESDVQMSEHEEEELSFSSAYVTQIAQRKTKPYNQKTAQQLIQTETEEYSQYVEDYGLKNAINSDNNSNFSNSNTKNTNFQSLSNYSQNNSNINNNNNNTKTVSNNTSINKSNNKSEISEEMPKLKQQLLNEQQRQQKAAKAAVEAKLNKEAKIQNNDKSIELAILANQRAETSKFTEAIDLFSQALSYNPTDYRFYVNRSYCYDSIQDYRNALKDAETAIQLRPDWPKCHYRRGKALAGLKNYQESEISLKKVLTLEKDCDEALSELWHVRYGAIVDMGYDTTTANIYSSQFESIKDALEALSIKGEKQKIFNFNNNFKKALNQNKTKNGFQTNNFEAESGQTWDDDDIYISDDEYNAIREPTYEETSPTNPFGWKALWVGNVSLNAKLDTVTAMFRKFGNLNYCNIFKGNNGGNFILVHYDNPESPRLAMTQYQNKVIPGVSITDTALTIRFRPNKDQKKPNYDQRLESDECYYWRTTGCARGDKCLYKHIWANRGVDKQAWMCNPLKKGLQPFHKSQK